MQTALPAILALTYPGEQTAAGLRSSGISGVFAPENRLCVLLPLLTVFTTSLANLTLVGPATAKIMRKRKQQGKLSETRDGKKSYDSPPHSKEMVRLNKAFGRMHGASALVNLVGFLGTVWYSVTLAGRL
ncbi:hypothetical protein FGG08_005473 [Glutinoglossum americanum]|uniref:TMEM205-like domain-containing protein n=1 Tax=Glutinoglossum americanum TaxID=1670608 RepID=A0A9P8I9C1_9PEZI|nr:hypothetical protein FGG08_005473 [Glutinoglossum americanum]